MVPCRVLVGRGAALRCCWQWGAGCPAAPSECAALRITRSASPSALWLGRGYAPVAHACSRPAAPPAGVLQAAAAQVPAQAVAASQAQTASQALSLESALGSGSIDCRASLNLGSAPSLGSAGNGPLGAPLAEPVSAAAPALAAAVETARTLPLSAPRSAGSPASVLLPCACSKAAPVHQSPERSSARPPPTRRRSPSTLAASCRCGRRCCMR